MKTIIGGVIAWGLIANCLADTLIVGNKSKAKLSIVDIPSNQIIKEISTDIGPHEVAVSPNQKFAAVVNYGERGSRGNSISLIDIQKGSIVKTTKDNRLSSPHGIQWFKDNQHVLVTAENQQTLVKVNLFTKEITAEIPTQGGLSHMLVISPDESFAATSNLGSADVSIVDLKHNKLKTKIATGEGAEGIDVTPDGKQLWVTNRSDDTVSIIETESFKVVENLKSQGFPIRVKITPNGNYALVTNAKANTLSIFDARKYSLLKTLSLSSTNDKTTLNFPIGVLVNAKGDTAFVAHARSNKVSVIDLKHLKRVSLLDSGETPDGMGYLEKKLNY